MIDYSLFQFACPPLCGGSWMKEALRIAGLQATYHKEEIPFTPKRSWSPFRVSLVRHPCSWLEAIYTSTVEIGRPSFPLITKFASLDFLNFDNFVRSYLMDMPGSIDELFGLYKAESYMRFEDLPSAVWELLDVFSFPIRQKTDRIIKSPVGLSWDPSLRRQFLQAENGTVELYEYY